MAACLRWRRGCAAQGCASQRDAHDNLLIPPSEITQFRDLSYNETQVLAKDYEEAALYRDMQGDTINQLVRRLGAVKLPS